MAIAHGRVAAQASSFATCVVGRVGSGFVCKSGKERTRPKEHDYKTSPPPDTVKQPSSRRGTWPISENRRRARDKKEHSSRKKRQENEKQPRQYGYKSNNNGRQGKHSSSTATSNTSTW